MGLSDESLLAGLASGEPEPATAFVRRFQARVYGLALTIVRDPKTAEEVAQEAFLRAWQHASAHDPRRGGVAPWLLTITRNVALDVVRLRRHPPVDPEEILALHVSSPEAGPEERGLTVYESQRLLKAMAFLPVEQRRALVLAAFYGRTAREVGEEEGISVGTAKTRIRTALLKVREALGVEHGA